MGIRDFVKGKIDKHGGVAGAARSLAMKPVRMVSGGRGARSSDPNPEARPDAILAALKNLPKDPDANGYVAVAPSQLVQPNKPGQFDALGQTVAVFRHDGKLFAIDNACLHEDGPMGEATQSGFVVTCSYHDWRYDVRDGKCLSAPGRKIACYDVAEHDGFIWVGRPKGDYSTERGGEHDDGLKTV